MKKSWKSFMTVTAAAAAMTAAMAFSSLAAVAKVGTQEFNNLQDAINSAGESPVVIDLEENVSLTDGLVIGAGKDVTIQCGTSDPKTIKMEGKGIHTEGTYDAAAKSWNTSRLTFKNCVLDITANDNPGGSGGTANLISNTDLTLDHVTWTQNSADGGSGSGMYLYQESNLYLVNGAVMTISGYKGSRASGIFADNSEYDDMPNRSIIISDHSSLNITDCDWHGMTVNPVDVTVEKYSHIDITGCGNPNYGGGIGCYYGKLSVTDHSDVTTLSNKHSIPTAVRSTALHSRRNNRQEKHEGSFRFLSTSCRYSPKPAACSNSTSSLARRIRKTRHAGKTLLPSSTQVPRPSRQYSRNSPFRHACREWSKTDTSPRSPCSRSTRPSPP